MRFPRLPPALQNSGRRKAMRRRSPKSAAFAKPIDTFFDKVMVMVDDERVRSNRLALLRDLSENFSNIADFSEIVTETKSS